MTDYPVQPTYQTYFYFGEMTDYPVQPTYQTYFYFGKVERAMNQQSITPRRVRIASSDSTGFQRSSIPMIPVTSKATTLK